MFGEANSRELDSIARLTNAKVFYKSNDFNKVLSPLFISMQNNSLYVLCLK